MLDEPTNHLDIEGQEALEAQLEASDVACLFVSHDRYSTRTAATRFLEIRRAADRGGRPRGVLRGPIASMPRLPNQGVMQNIITWAGRLGLLIVLAISRGRRAGSAPQRRALGPASGRGRAHDVRLPADASSASSLLRVKPWLIAGFYHRPGRRAGGDADLRHRLRDLPVEGLDLQRQRRPQPALAPMLLARRQGPLRTPLPQDCGDFVESCFPI